jgi:hypothetical protein
VPGCYYVEFGTLPTYTRTVADTGADETDSDANVATGRTGVYTLASGGTNLTVDAGLLPPPQLLIKEYTNGDDADSPTGPFITVGGAVNWTYVVTNTGNVVLHDVVVTDNGGVTVSCPKTTLAVGEVMTCTATGTAVAGQYSNIGSVTGRSPGHDRTRGLRQTAGRWQVEPDDPAQWLEARGHERRQQPVLHLHADPAAARVAGLVPDHAAAEPELHDRGQAHQPHVQVRAGGLLDQQQPTGREVHVQR